MARHQGCDDQIIGCCFKRRNARFSCSCLGQLMTGSFQDPACRDSDFLFIINAQYP
jgi:hypothetical protein